MPSLPRWSPLAALAVGGGLYGLLSLDTPPPPVTAPPLAEMQLLLSSVYELEKDGLKVPMEWAKPVIARAGLEAWILTLPLPDDVRARVRAHVEAPGLLDEMVPFALFVKEMYGRGGETFADHARAAIPRRTGVPGFEHTLFRYAPPPAKEAGGAGMSAGLAAKLLTLYDAVFLRDAPADAGVEERLSCDQADLDRTSARAKAAEPIVRDLLRELGAAGEGDIGAAVDAVLRDDAVLDTVTFTLVRFVDGEVCKHYRVFARQVRREHGLREWGDTMLAGDDQERLWAWLEWSRTRPRAVQVVVDGLQGQLVESLVRGEAGDPFLTTVARDDRERPRPVGVLAEPAPPMETGFLQHVAAHGHADPTYLPYLRTVVASPGFARQGIATTPTISVRNLPIAKTGAPVAGPGGTGIPNFHFVDRAYPPTGEPQGRGWYFYGNDALLLTELTQAAGMRTMFERLPTHATMSCGAQYDEAAGYSLDSFLALAIGEADRDFGERVCLAELERRGQNEARLTELRTALLDRREILATRHDPWELYDRWQQRTERARARELWAELASLEPASLPDHLLYYNPWPDHFAHGKGPYSDEIVGPTGELARLDHWLGRIAGVYRTAGVEGRTLYGMAGDHGLTPVWWLVRPEEQVFEALAREGKPLRVKKISSDEGEGPKLTDPRRPPSMKGYDAVVASTAGGNYMLDLFVDQGAGWTRQPVASEVRAYRTLGGATLDLVAELTRRLGDSLDYLAVREAACTPEGGTISLHARRAGVAAEGRITRKGDHVRYTYTGADLLDLATPSPYDPPAPEAWARAAAERERCLAVGDDPATWCTEAEWRALTAGTVRPDSVAQLAHLYDTDRAGTINLFPRPGVGYNSKVPGRHAGEHFAEKDAFVGLWGAPVAAGERVDTAVNGEVPMALYAWLTGELPRAGDGWGYPDELAKRALAGER